MIYGNKFIVLNEDKKARKKKRQERINNNKFNRELREVIQNNKYNYYYIDFDYTQGGVTNVVVANTSYGQAIWNTKISIYGIDELLDPKYNVTDEIAKINTGGCYRKLNIDLVMEKNSSKVHKIYEKMHKMASIDKSQLASDLKKYANRNSIFRKE